MVGGNEEPRRLRAMRDENENETGVMAASAGFSYDGEVPAAKLARTLLPGAPAEKRKSWSSRSAGMGLHDSVMRENERDACESRAKHDLTLSPISASVAR